MDDMELRKLFESAGPKQSQEARMLNQIVSGEFKAKKRAQRRKMIPAIAVAACLFLVIGGLSVDALTGKRLMNMFSSNNGYTTAKKSVAEVTKEPDSTKNSWQDGGIAYELCNGTNFSYDSEMVYCSEHYAIVAGYRGLVILDRDNSSLYRSVDIQRKGYNFFDLDEKKTTVLFDEDELQLMLYNTEKDVIQDDAVLYTINPQDATEQVLTNPETISTSSDSFISFKQKNEKDGNTREFVPSDNIFEQDKYNQVYYSYAFTWKNSEGKEVESVLGAFQNTENPAFCISDVKGNTKIINKTKFNISNVNWSELPEYNVAESSKLLDCVNDCIVKEMSGGYRDTHYLPSAVIPYAVIYGIEEEGNEVKVFGEFDLDIVEKCGISLYSCAGGIGPGVMHFEKQGDDYVLKQLVLAEDGSDYKKSIQKMCTGYEKYVDLLLNGDRKGTKRTTKQQQNVQAYIMQNNLSYNVLKNFGWPDVELY